MRRGEICLADLDPMRGSEANKTRPVVIVSNDGANRRAEQLGRGVVTVVPLTTNTGRVYPFQVRVDSEVSGLHEPSKAQAEQVRSIDVQRIGSAIGRLSPAAVAELDDALRLHLGL